MRGPIRSELAVASLLVLAACGSGQPGEIMLPSDDRNTVGMGLVEHPVERLHGQTRCPIVDSKTTFFGHHVSLGIELPEDRIDQAVALHPEPEFQVIRGELKIVYPFLVTRDDRLFPGGHSAAGAAA